uniref:RNA-directed RNA polymerase n=1 Tax=Leviviridae sp. TaxID=2027243 RepID=A0A514CZP2_9VIRU|nr:MAG: RNA-dependent RNA polymerase [Leviviridae sp.]
MVDKNSLDTYVSLTVQLYHDIAQCYPDTHETARDMQTLHYRVQKEGVSFLTKTLPKLGKALDSALHSDSPLLVRGFRLKPGTAIPRFLGWLLERIFSEDGYVRGDPDITALKHLRQFLYFTYKLKLPYDSETESSVIESFVSTQTELEALCFDSSLRPVINAARTFVTRLFDGYDVRDIIPRHGPGAVATGEEVGEKSNFSRLYKHTERTYPFTEYFVLGINQVADQFDWLQSLEVLEHGTAKVVLVPKDSRGPRLISKEPLELQWIQQGIQKSLYSWIENHPLTRGFVNFTDQSINRRLALRSSRDQKFVTLDMKDASDRVTLRLVEELFSGTGLLEALLASRSSFTQLPDGREVRLSTFAPMGSAVCFPIEALCFYALAVAVLYIHGRGDIRNKPLVYVYGDDIITRREDFALLLQYFPKFGLRFNSDKCCVSGFFRESCGCDAYKGIDVTPIRLRNTWSHQRNRDALQLVSYVELSNSLWEKGYWMTADLIMRMVEDRYGPLPYLREKRSYIDLAGRIKCDSPSLIGWYRDHVHQSVNSRLRGRRFNRHLHRIEYNNWIVRPVYNKYKVDGWRECLRSMNQKVQRENVELFYGEGKGAKLGVYALPHRVCLRRGWAPV